MVSDYSTIIKRDARMGFNVCMLNKKLVRKLKTCWISMYFLRCTRRCIIALALLGISTLFIVISMYGNGRITSVIGAYRATSTAPVLRKGLKWKDGVPVKMQHPSILCLILTSAKNKEKMAAVRDTWGKRCDKKYFLYGESKDEPDGTDVLKLSVTEGRSHLTGKVRAAFAHAYTELNNTFDWILKCDDDTYVIMENLRHMLSHASPKVPGYLGFHMKPHLKNGYMSGGAGYVISSSALHHVINIGFKNNSCKQDGGDEDVEIGKCLQASGVHVLSSLDARERETFHAESLVHHLRENKSWIRGYAWNKNSLGENCCSQYSTTYHYVKPNEMYIFEHLLYKTSVYSSSNTDLHNGTRLFDLRLVS